MEDTVMILTCCKGSSGEEPGCWSNCLWACGSRILGEAPNIVGPLQTNHKKLKSQSCCMTD